VLDIYFSTNFSINHNKNQGSLEVKKWLNNKINMEKDIDLKLLL